MILTRQRIDCRSGKVAIIRRTSMSYDRLMQVVAEQAMQRAMVQINRRTPLIARASSVPDMRERFGAIKLTR